MRSVNREDRATGGDGARMRRGKRSESEPRWIGRDGQTNILLEADFIF